MYYYEHKIGADFSNNSILTTYPKCSNVLYAGAISVALVLPFVTAWQELDDFHASLLAHTAAAGFHRALQ